jgi:hypothetical protein
MAVDAQEDVLVACTVKWEVLAYITRHLLDTCVGLHRYKDNGGSDYDVMDLEKELADV